MSDRILGIIIAMVALAFFASATQLETPFFSDPVGPKTFPYFISVIAFLASTSIILKPETEPKWPGLITFGSISIAVLVLVSYAYALRPFGFIFPTALAASLLSYQIKPSFISSVLTGSSLSIGLFVIFKFFLGLGLFAFPRWFFS